MEPGPEKASVEREVAPLPASHMGGVCIREVSLKEAEKGSRFGKGHGDRKGVSTVYLPRETCDSVAGKKILQSCVLWSPMYFRNLKLL